MPFGFKNATQDRLERIEAMFQRMFVDNRHAFDLAMSALVGGADHTKIRPELRATDHRINEAERTIRRELLVHASVHGSIDTPAVLVYMSIVKDVERIGDYAKNLIDLARDGANLGVGDTAPRLIQLRDEVSRMIADVADAFRLREAERAHQLLAKAERMLDDFDAHVSALVQGKDEGRQPVARALAERYLKRIVAHLSNVLSAVVMPVDQLDYYDEDAVDRAR
jgi:phosphate uptake regulator